MKLEDIQWALITGATSGIGTALSHFLAGKGINLILHGRKNEALNKLAAELQQKVQIKTVVADLASAQERKAILLMIHQWAPELVINNAGFGLYGDALSHETDTQLELLEVNGTALLQLTLEASRTLISHAKKGVIMNIASVAAFPVFPTLAVYGAAKAFVVQLSQSLDEELSPYGVRVLVACPGMVDTNFVKRAGGIDQKKKASAFDATMSVEEAVEHICTQIITEKTLTLFNWFYRLTNFFVMHVLPKKWVATFLKKTIYKRYHPQPLIKIRNLNDTF